MSENDYHLVLQHAFSVVDDPKQSDSSGQPKWLFFNNQYRLNRAYHFAPDSLEEELFLLKLLYLTDVLGSSALELTEKPELLTSKEREDLRFLGGGEGQPVNENKSVTTVLVGSLPQGCGISRFEPTPQQMKYFATVRTTDLPAFAIFRNDVEPTGEHLAHVRGWAARAATKPTEAVFSLFVYEKTYVFESIRAAAVLNGISLDETDTIASLIFKLYERAQGRSRKPKQLCGPGLGEWKDLIAALIAQPAQITELTDDEKKKGGAWANIENGWRGTFLDLFIRNGGLFLLKMKYVPENVVRFGLKAFGVSDSPNPSKTLEILVERVMDKATMLFMIWTSTKIFPSIQEWEASTEDVTKQFLATFHVPAL